MNNILFLAGGRRVTLAERFAAKGCHVFSYEIKKHCPISSVATVIPGLSWDDSKTADHIRKIVADKCIDAVVPLSDQACVFLAEMEGLGVEYKVIGSKKTAQACYDKKRFEQIMSGLPHLYPTVVKEKSAIIKPQFGNSSIGVMRIEKYHPWFHLPDGYVAQKELTGPEYSVDAYFNRQEELVGASPRLRLRTSGGEVIESITVDEPELVEMVRTLGGLFCFRGPICAQFMRDSDGSWKVFEINSRFGGGCTLSLRAGFDMIGYLITEYCGPNKGVVPRNSGAARPNVEMTRAFRDVYFE